MNFNGRSINDCGFRYVIDDDRAIFMFKDGAQAWVAKDYLVGEERCESVTIDNKVYEGEYSKKVLISIVIDSYLLQT